MRADHPLPKELVSSPDFRSDVMKLVSLDKETLAKLRDNLPSTPDQLKLDDFVSNAARNSKLSVKDYLDVSPIARLFISGVAIERFELNQLVDFLISELKLEISEEQLLCFKGFLAPTKNESLEGEEVNAFAFGDTFSSVAFKPLISPSEDGTGRLFYGGNVEIGYIDASARKRVLALSISVREMETLVGFLQQSVKQLQQLKSLHSADEVA